MAENPDPVLYSEEHIIQFVQDYARYDARNKSAPYRVLWDGTQFACSSPRELVESILVHVALSTGL